MRFPIAKKIRADSINHACLLLPDAAKSVIMRLGIHCGQIRKNRMKHRTQSGTRFDLWEKIIKQIRDCRNKFY